MDELGEEKYITTGDRWVPALSAPDARQPHIAVPLWIAATQTRKYIAAPVNNSRTRKTKNKCHR